MTNLEKAYEMLNGDEPNTDGAIFLYLSCYKNPLSKDSEKCEALMQLGYICLGQFDDEECDSRHLDYDKAEKYFIEAAKLGSEKAKLELALLFCVRQEYKKNDFSFVCSELMNNNLVDIYKNEIYSILKKRLKSTFDMSFDELVDELKITHSLKKQKVSASILRSINELLYLLTSELIFKIKRDNLDIDQCTKIKKNLLEITDRSAISEILDAITIKTLSLEMDSFDDISNESRIKFLLRKLNKHNSFEQYNYYSDFLKYKMAVSFAYGINDAPKDDDIAIFYFSEIRFSSLLDDVDNDLVEITKKLVAESNFKKAERYAKCTKNRHVIYFLFSLIYQKQEAVEFNDALDKSNSGDLEAMLKIGNYYLLGRGVEKDENKAIEAFKNVYYFSNSKIAFDALYELLPLEEKQKLLIDAKTRSIPFNEGQNKEYKTLIKNEDAKKPLEKVISSSSINKNSIRVDDSDRKKIAEEIKKRGIQKLIHFTSRKNLTSIRNVGAILSRKQLINHSEIDFDIMDDNRFDDELNCISVSITKPNKYMLRQKISEGRLVEPCIIEIDPCILLDPDVNFKFCERNAARRDIAKGSTFSAFLQMFQSDKAITFTDRCGFFVTRTRAELNRKDNETTDEQAEILVESKIPVKYIICARKYEW